MKKLIASLTLVAFIATIFCTAQAQEGMKMKERQTVKMKDGKMMVKKGMMWSEMKSDIKMVDGTQISKNGAVVMADGTKKTMKEGEEMHFGHKKMKNGNKVSEEKTVRDEKTVK